MITWLVTVQSSKKWRQRRPKKKNDYKGKKEKGLAGTWDEEHISDEEGSESELANVCFMAIDDEVFFHSL